MSPLIDRCLASSTLIHVIDDLPADFPMDNLVERVRSGLATVWLEGRNTVMVTSLFDSKSLLVDLLFSKTSGALARNWSNLIAFMQLSNVRFLVCKPWGESQSRLYRRYGFYNTGRGYMTYDRLKPSE